MGPQVFYKLLLVWLKFGESPYRSEVKIYWRTEELYYGERNNNETPLPEYVLFGKIGTKLTSIESSRKDAPSTAVFQEL